MPVPTGSNFADERALCGANLEGKETGNNSEYANDKEEDGEDPDEEVYNNLRHNWVKFNAVGLVCSS
ncbi:hypothetical protein MJO28_003117 [Puccinia striiformis f. sp. tritici]|uniref:Uncharacterized protein n=1 Tax=Puccinia striiformis f. sp. tritici TaxID=168172 RepID=A0ACC0ETW2_9BASI|nr:hypothetical protein MJO28_003117 [Puccinia striiformis f. sp. tritici]